MAGGGPTIHRRRLGRLLRELREGKELTGDAAGRAVERSGSWISRVESGRIGLRSRDLRDLLDLYSVSDSAQREELEALARQGRQRDGWSRYAKGLPEPLTVFLGLEDAASSVKSYQDGVVPGLLQTEEYCRAIIQQAMAAAGESAAGVDLRVRVRMARQSRLEQNPRQLQFLVDERTLYRTIGGQAVLRDQLDHLLTATRQPYIDFRAVPFSQADRGAVASSFIIMSFPDDPGVVWLETPIGLAYEDGDAEFRAYQRIFESLAKVALDPDATRQLITEARDQLN